MPRSRTRAVVVALVVAAIGGGVTFGILRTGSRGSDPAVFPFAAVGAAPAPYTGFGTARVRVGNDCLEVLVAADDRTRGLGLRRRTTTRPYAGMLFAFPTMTDAGFTMAGVPVPLDITWFAADGAPVDRARMAPCPDGTDADCPVYGSDRPFRYALERTAPSAPVAGALGGC
ncbi:MAG: DUF192 domain-containing protein [Actinomycetota bacterium]